MKQPLPLPQGVSDYAVGAAKSMSSQYSLMRPVPAAPAYDKSEMEKSGARDMKGQEQSEGPNTGSGGAGLANRTITLGDVTASGGLSKEAVSKVVKERMGDLEKYCRGFDSVARLTVSFKIDAKGAVREVKVLKGGADLRRDIADQIQKWRFPSAGDGAETSATITLLLGL